jgi:heterodisulfide reductase subunit A-like polyferredoxin
VFLPKFDGQLLSREQVWAEIKGKTTIAEASHLPEQVLIDKLNCEMMQNVQPLNWTDPQDSTQVVYDMVTIGGGAAGMVTAAGTAQMGLRAMMIERQHMGGDCLVTGCVPSKAFLKSA